MLDANFDTIFSDLIDENTEALSFVQCLQEIMPDGLFRMYTLDGDGIGEAFSWQVSDEDRKKIFRALETGANLTSLELTDKEWVFGTNLERFEAFLVFQFPGLKRDLTRHPFDEKWLQGIIDHALLRQDYQEMATEKEQFVRQVETLKQQHGKLIEDNYRQYRINQEKEKEYAKRLESEIAAQTSELREKNIQLEKFSRLQSDFLANMSHELRTPMNAIIGFADLLSETTLDEDQNEYTKIISQSADTLLVLINDILDLAKIEAGKLNLESEPFDLDELAKNVIAMFRLPAQKKNIDLILDIDPKLPRVIIGDSTRLKQVLVNLAGNAMKFTEKGCIEIQIAHRQELDGGEQIAFSVRDTGIGIPPERQRAIFDKFTQADGSTTRKYGGTGLGLAICDQLVGIMGGGMAVESVVGEGSAFSFAIPLKSPAETTLRDEFCADEICAKGLQDEDVKKGKILLVEDNLVNQRLASIIVTKQGHDVEISSDGLEALEQLEREKFDVVLMDIQMPNMDGLAATRKIREIEADSKLREQYASLKGRLKPLTIIGLTAHARKEDEKSCLAAGMDGYLTKPIHKGKLIAVLGKFMQERQEEN